MLCESVCACLSSLLSSIWKPRKKAHTHCICEGERRMKGKRERFHLENHPVRLVFSFSFFIPSSSRHRYLSLEFFFEGRLKGISDYSSVFTSTGVVCWLNVFVKVGSLLRISKNCSLSVCVCCSQWIEHLRQQQGKDHTHRSYDALKRERHEETDTNCQKKWIVQCKCSVG